MRNIKGKTKILLKENGKEKVFEDENMITGALEDSIIALTNFMFRQENVPYSKGIFSVLDQVPFINAIKGIYLFGKHQSESKLNTLLASAPVAYAGDAYDLSDPKRGSLNTQESGPISNGMVKGYRFVWDFGSSNGNTTFNSVCLTTSIGGNGLACGIGSNRMINGSKNSEGYMSRNPLDLNFNSKAKAVITKNGILYHIDSQTDKAIKRIDFNNSFNISDPYRPWKATNIVIPNVSKIAYSLVDMREEKDTLMFAGKDDTTGKWNLMTMEMESQTIISKKELTSVDVDITHFSIFGDVGNEYILINNSIGNADKDSSNINGTYQYYSSWNILLYDLKKGLFHKKRVNFLKVKGSSSSIPQNLFVNSWSDNYKNSGQMEPITIKLNNKYVTVFSSSGYYSASSWYGGTGFLYNIKNIEIIENIPNDTKDYEKYQYDVDEVIDRFFGETKIANPTESSLSVPIAGIGSVNFNNNSVAYMFLCPTLFSINNLAEPITKTESNTMKITYELTWE